MPARRRRRSLPPQSLDELRSLLANIKARQTKTHLGARSFRTLAGLVDSPRQSAVYSISELAGGVGVNASTLTRLAKRLGYGGFGDLQDVFRRHVAEERDFYSERAGHLLSKKETPRSSISLMTKVAQEENANVSSMLKSIDARALEQAAGRLAEAPRVRTYGLRQFFSIACFVSYSLGMVRSEVAVLGESGHGVAHALAQLAPGDVILVLGSFPYTRSTVDVCRAAAAHDVYIIAITDSSASPLATSANQTFITPTRGTFFSNSMASCLILAEGLLALVTQRLGKKSLAALKRREMFIDELGIAI